MSPYLFIFGRTPELSFLELSSIFPSVSRIVPEVALVNEEIDVFAMQQRLGGTVKIARVVGDLAKPAPEWLAEFLLNKAKEHPLVFGLSFYGVPPHDATSWASQIKSQLSQQGVSSRFVSPKHGSALSSVVIAKQKLIELVVVASKEGSWYIGETAAVQDFEDWSKRDFGRPAPDPHAGMLPPKVARMIVNIALADIVISRGAYRGSSFARSVKVQTSVSPSTLSAKAMTELEKTRRTAPTPVSKVVLDPFCGVGTILAEALLLGCRVVGSDQSPTAIANTRKNLDWLAAQYPQADLKNSKIFCSDATHVSEVITPASVDAIATEPFLGDPSLGATPSRASQGKIQNTIKGLEKLYIGCLRDWHRVLKPQGRVVIAFPSYSFGGKEYSVKTVVDRCETLGYTLLTGPIEYSRPQAVVKREFYVFKRK